MKTITTKTVPPFVGTANGLMVTSANEFTLEVAAFTAAGDEIQFTVDTELARGLAIALIEEAGTLDRDLNAQLNRHRRRYEQPTASGPDADDDIPF
jgi:hypothetical protein